jgi:intergrase/recombinase
MIKLELNSKRNNRKYSNTWRLNITLLNEQWVIEKIREEIQKFLELMKMKTQPTRTFEIQQRQC